MSTSQPAPPNPYQIVGSSEQTAKDQLQQQNIPAQAGSQYNQGNYYGGLNYQQTGTGPGGVPLYSATTSFSPSQLQAANQTTGTQLEAGSQAANALGFGNYGSISPTQQIGNMTQGETGQLMNTWLGSQVPFFNTQTDQLRTQLMNNGLKPGDPGYDIAMRQLQTNQGLGVAGAASQFEPQAFNQAEQLYGLPMNVGQQLAQWGAPISPTNQFTSQLPSLQSGNIADAMRPLTQAFMNQYQAQQAQANAQNSAMGGLFGMAGNALAGMLPGLSSAGATALGMGPFLVGL